MFTTLMTDEFRTQVNRIRIDHPIEFDFAQDLCEYLESLRKDVFLEHELCALYVIRYRGSARQDSPCDSAALREGHLSQ